MSIFKKEKFIEEKLKQDVIDQRKLMRYKLLMDYCSRVAKMYNESSLGADMTIEVTQRSANALHEAVNIALTLYSE